MGKLAGVDRGFAGDFIPDGVAGGVAVSRVAAEFSGAGIQERIRGVVDGVDAVWTFTHYESGIPELAVRDSGGDCGAVLWMDVEENGIDFCFGAGACRGGCDLAFFVSDDVGKLRRELPAVQSGEWGESEKRKLRFRTQNQSGNQSLR